MVYEERKCLFCDRPVEMGTNPYALFHCPKCGDLDESETYHESEVGIEDETPSAVAG